ncbi:uncharacterized protein LOC110737034 [Chenopodium quinoa]|uniref:uncharacterized protein LOC110737034 n=1 Tax=Chenopodium quinoa TaxID=63459 RepID=UPI000B7778B9|nr:uncharacterized protein LOC110737034 [Chenopodium quinoa]
MTLPLVPLNLKLEKVVRANRREKRAIASGATSSEPRVVVESDHSSSSESSGDTIPLESPRTNSPTSSPFQDFEMAAPNKTLREFGVPPPYQEASGIATPAIEANNFEIRPALITLIEGHQFSGAKHEDPVAHLKQFTRYCSTVKANGVTPEYILLSMFKFSLTGKASDWLDRLPPNSLNTRNEVTSAFLGRFIPLGKTAELRSKISNFQQEPDESLYDAWERFKSYQQQYPHHGMEDWLLIHGFYRGLLRSDRILLDGASGGPIMNKPPTEALKIIEDVVQNYTDWSPDERSTSKKGGKYEVNAINMINSKLDALSSKFDQLQSFSLSPSPRQNSHASSSLNENMSIQMMSCDTCGSDDHVTSECYLLNDSCSPSPSMEQVNAINNGQTNPRYDPYSNTYNEGWKHHPNFGWKGGQTQGNGQGQYSGQRNVQNNNQGNYRNQGSGNYVSNNQVNQQNDNRYHQRGQYSSNNNPPGFNGGNKPTLAPIPQPPLQIQAPPPKSSLEITMEKFVNAQTKKTNDLEETIKQVQVHNKILETQLTQLVNAIKSNNPSTSSPSQE